MISSTKPSRPTSAFIEGNCDAAARSLALASSQICSRVKAIDSPSKRLRVSLPQPRSILSLRAQLRMDPLQFVREIWQPSPAEQGRAIDAKQRRDVADAFAG